MAKKPTGGLIREKNDIIKSKMAKKPTGGVLKGDKRKEN